MDSIGLNFDLNFEHNMNFGADRMKSELNVYFSGPRLHIRGEA